MESNKLSLPIIIGALVTAIIGGAVWAFIAILTDYEIGFVAWAIGGLAGYSVFYLAKGKATTAHQVIAVIASLIGILLGKYFIIGYYYNGSFSGVFESEAMTWFLNHLSVSFGYMDIVFILLAVATAWKLPRRLVYKGNVVESTKDVAE